MRFGAHVRAGKGLVPALQHGADIGAEVIQIFTQSPRMWKPSQYSPEVLADYREAQSENPSVTGTFCHATYLINLASPDAELASKSRACLNANLATAEGIGSDGLVLHIGSHRGKGFEASVPAVVDALIEALDSVDTPGAVVKARKAGGTKTASTKTETNSKTKATAKATAKSTTNARPNPPSAPPSPCPILLENAAGAGDTVGRSFEELAQIIEAADSDERLGVCLDTQHLWASGIPFATTEDADALVALVEATVGLERLRCLHLNDSKVEFGANRDRHENIGEGTIGAEGLAALLGHPDLQGLAAILEVPGVGDGPRAEDVAKARAVWERGIALRS
jgi:deoxyribonuclease IV